MLRLRNCLLPLLRAAPPIPSPVNPCAYRRLSTSTSTSTSASPVPFSLEDYLVASCGVAPARAREACKAAFRELARESGGEEISRSRLFSASNPDAIVALIAGAGLARADIAAAVSADPLLLRASVKNTAPRLLALRDRAGLSAPQIARFLQVAPGSLRRGDVAPKLVFFVSICGMTVDKVLLAAKRNRSLFMVSFERLIKPNIALFRQWGVRDIAQLCSNFPRVLSYNPKRVKEFLPRAEQLGVPPTSGLFGQALGVISCLSEEKLAAKLEFFKRTLGCSESELSAAVPKAPSILALSDEILLRKIQFLVNEAAIEPWYIVERPIMLTYSLEKRLVPRHNVMKVLQEKGLLNSNAKFSTILNLGEETFKLKFVDCHKDSVPGLVDVYAAPRAGIVPSKV